MPDDYLRTYLPARLSTIYEQLRRAFPSTMPLGGPITHDSFPGRVSEFFRDLYDAFVAKVDGDRGDFVDPAQSANLPLAQTLAWLWEPSGATPWTDADLCDALGEQLALLAEQIDAAVQRQPELAGTRELDALRRGCVSMGLGAIAKLQWRGGEERLDLVTGELRLRHACSVVHEVVGDPPAAARLGYADTPENYLRYATSRLHVSASVRYGTEPARNVYLERDLLDLTERLATAPAERADLLHGLAQAADYLLAQTRQSIAEAEVASAARRGAPGPDYSWITKGAAEATALCAVLAEGMRGVLGMRAQGRGRFDADHQPDPEELVRFGAERAKDIAERGERRDRREEERDGRR